LPPYYPVYELLFGPDDDESDYFYTGNAEDMDYLTRLTLQLGAVAIDENRNRTDQSVLDMTRDLIAGLPTGAHIDSNGIVDGNGDKILSGVFITANGLLGINIKEYKLLPPMLIKVIRLLNRDIMIFYLYEGRWNSILVPAGADLPVGLPFGSI
jgi:hypothetical protein